MAVLALYELFAGEDGAQVVVVATDERQAGLCFRSTLAILDEAGRIDREVFEVVTWPPGSSGHRWRWPSAPPTPSSTRPCWEACAGTWPSMTTR